VARLGRRQDAELRHVGRPEEQEAGFAQPPYEVGVVRRPVTRQEARGEVHAQTGDGGVRLDPDRHAGEGAPIAGSDCGRLGDGAIPVELDERPDLRVQRLDPPDRGLHHLAGAHRSIADPGGQDRRGKEGERVHEGAAAYAPDPVVSNRPNGPSDPLNCAL
jgi:hypothetical protein